MTKVTTTKRKVRQESNFISCFKINLSSEQCQFTPVTFVSPDRLKKEKEEKDAI